MWRVYSAKQILFHSLVRGAGQNIPGQNIPCQFLTPRTKHPTKICHPGQNIPCCFCRPGQNIPCHFCHPGQNIPCHFCHHGQNIPFYRIISGKNSLHKSSYFLGKSRQASCYYIDIFMKYI